MLKSLFKRTKNTLPDTISGLLDSNIIRSTNIGLIGNSPTRKSGFISNVFAPMAAEAGESFAILRQSEALLLEECIKELSTTGHSILSVAVQKNKELTEHVVEIIGKQAVTRPTHVIIRYPDDADFFENQADTEIPFITSCMGSFFRSKAAYSTNDSDATNDEKEHIRSLTRNKRVPLYLGDMDRYLVDNDFFAYTFVALSQLRGLGYQAFLNMNVKDQSSIDSKLWEIFMASTICRILLETDISKAKTICAELSRYLDAQFQEADSEFRMCHSLDIRSEKLCSMINDKNGLVRPVFLAMK